ncbi:MAG: hypothetical protein CVV47_06865 [Spirochaetae bacterium HGW-Spirochaetae-3]|jgi:hypothetical protein|nr:MAG: hypothetical protein CVV47_06865 [Spirochaetae bacterium HGW-Spirochaetae-3]
MASRTRFIRYARRRVSGRIAAIISAAVLAALIASCSGKEGWAVVLWPPEGSAIAFGSVVPVHFKSNITKTYAIGVPGSSAKEELELWRVEAYRQKSKAQEAAAGYGDLAPVLGVSARDGLILRSKPDNSTESVQVYRLRLGQPVKLLHKVEGAAVETGGQRLEGDWYLALADDGTIGYVFSNQLQLWNAEEGPMPDLKTGSPAADATLATLFDTVWRPDYFDTMVASGLLDLGSYQPRFGLFTDPLRKQIRVERPEFSKVYRYDTISAAEDGSYTVTPGDASFRFTKAGALVFTPAESDLSPGLPPEAPRSFEFVHHDKDIQAVIAAEERRRLSRLSDFVSAGERYESESYGVLIITRSARFTWVANGVLSPGYIPEGSGDTGSVVMDLYLSGELAASWDGAFTLRFDAIPRSPVSFAYRTTGDELFLAYLPPESIHNAVVSAPDGLEPVAAFDRYR